MRDRLRVSQSSPYGYFLHTPCLTDFTFEFIRRPTLPILSPSSRTFVELTLISYSTNFGNEFQMALNAYLHQINHSFCSAHPISTNL
jgi:hypothetical protein